MADDTGKLRTEVFALTAEVAKLQALVAEVVSRHDDDGVRQQSQQDAAWKCEKCRSLLGFYDQQTDVMRIRYKDHVTYVRIGPGGFVQVICRGCGHVNTEEYVSEEELASQREATAARADEVPVITRKRGR